MTTKARTLWAFGLSSIAIFMTALDNLVVTTGLPVIKRQLGGGIDTLEWTVNGYTLTFAVLLLTGAALGDRFGRRACSPAASPSSPSGQPPPRSPRRSSS